MVVHIAPIGTETAHVIEWLRNGSVEKIYLLHSRKTAKVDFPKRNSKIIQKIWIPSPPKKNNNSNSFYFCCCGFP